MADCCFFMCYNKMLKYVLLAEIVMLSPHDIKRNKQWQTKNGP